MTPELAVQKAVRLRLVGSSALVALVPAASILDRNERPAPVPSIILGESLSIDDGDSVARNKLRIVMDVHIWKREPGLTGAKEIAGALRAAIKAAPMALDEGFHCGDCRVVNMRFLRDPDGETAHGVVTLETIVEELI